MTLLGDIPSYCRARSDVWTSLLASHTVHPVVSSLATECSAAALQNSLKLLPQLRLSVPRERSSHITCFHPVQSCDY